MWGEKLAKLHWVTRNTHSRAIRRDGLLFIKLFPWAFWNQASATSTSWRKYHWFIFWCIFKPYMASVYQLLFTQLFGRSSVEFIDFAFQLVCFSLLQWEAGFSFKMHTMCPRNSSTPVFIWLFHYFVLLSVLSLWTSEYVSFFFLSSQTGKTHLSRQITFQLWLWG